MNKKTVTYVPEGQSKAWLIAKRLAVLWVIGAAFFAIAITITGNESLWYIPGLFVLFCIPAAALLFLCRPPKR